jgi:nucleoside-diphosphate-sugar epimerase
VDLCVFGASGPVGRAVVDRALRAGHGVTAVTRRPRDFGLEAPRLRVVGADVTDLAQVTAALEGAEAVISTTGVNPSRRPISMYSVGTRNLLEAMRALGVRRIVGVSSKNLAEEGAHGEPLLFRFALAPLLRVVNRTIYEDMGRMERLLRDSDADWTIVRPAGLFAAEHVSAYRCTAGHEPGVFTSTVDLADALVAEAVSERPRVGEVIEVLTDDGTPSLPALIAGQASLHRR